MRKLVLVTLLFIVPILAAGCSPAEGVSQEKYDQQLAENNELQEQINLLEAQLENVGGEVADIPEDSAAETHYSETETEIVARELSVISAYLLWQDYYNQYGILDQTDDEFSERLGTLVAGIENTNLQTAYYAYYKAEVAYRQVLATLPKDDSAWTRTQYDNWVAAGAKRSETLGQVGGHLEPLLETIPWFNP